MMAKKAVRCAIYTRKSTDEGLEQDFNSLDAQFEACSAYITSQKGEGWSLIQDRYDDGGISGATLERPGLQRLLAHMDAGTVDLIVVYKVDRLTRSLADFARLVDRFDAAGTSFVSVTQQFNTATSMGRLTLNVLLSFAQFEREVTAERIRDKIAASKKKGLWMGGLVPLGYDAHERTLVINEQEAGTVRILFRLYLELGSVRRLKEEADRLGLVTKKRQLASGDTTGGVSFSRGRLYHLLSNPVYAGEIRHKAKSYPGQHPAIIDKVVFDAVQERLKASKRGGNGRVIRADSSPLTGKFVDETGDGLTPSHAVRHGRRHRYYVSRRLIARSGEPRSDGWRLPATALEGAVAGLIVKTLRSSGPLPAFIRRVSPGLLQGIPARIEELSARLAGPSRGPLIGDLVDSGRIAPGQISLTLSPPAIAGHLDVDAEYINDSALSIAGAFTLRRRGVEARLVLENGAASIDSTLVRTVARGWAWFEEIKFGASMQEIAKREGITQRRVAHLVDLAFLAPDIIQAIVTAERLRRQRQIGLSEFVKRLQEGY
jgi:DNA invertase Pin-like site-specific DNA recombinase